MSGLTSRRSLRRPIALDVEFSSLNKSIANYDANYVYVFDGSFDEFARCHNFEIEEKDKKIAVQDKVNEALRKEVSRLKLG